jgi:hypothetical protein
LIGVVMLDVEVDAVVGEDDVSESIGEVKCKCDG